MIGHINQWEYYKKHGRYYKNWTIDETYKLYLRAIERKKRIRKEYDRTLEEIINLIPPSDPHRMVVGMDIRQMEENLRFSPAWEIYTHYDGKFIKLDIHYINENSKLYSGYSIVEPSRESNLESLLTLEDGEENRLLQKFMLLKQMIYSKLDERVFINLRQLIGTNIQFKFEDNDKPSNEIFSIEMFDGSLFMYKKEGWGRFTFLGIVGKQFSYKEIE